MDVSSALLENRGKLSALCGGKMKATNEPKMGPTEFAAEVERLKAEGKFPTLETLLAAIAEARAEFAPKILAARRGKKTA
jgi:hypothetical protein